MQIQYFCYVILKIFKHLKKMYLYSSPSSQHIVPNVDILLGHAYFARLMTRCRGCLAIIRTALPLFRVIAILYFKFLEEGPFLLSPAAPRIVFEIECSVNTCGNGLNSLSPLQPQSLLLLLESVWGPLSIPRSPRHPVPPWFQPSSLWLLFSLIPEHFF